MGAFEINLLRNNIDQQSQRYNRFKIDDYTRTLECIVTGVNAENMTVSILVPTLSSKFNNVLIGNNIIGSTSMILLPKENQKGLVLMSSSHNPVFLCTIPDKTTSNSIAGGEYKVGNEECSLNIRKDNSLSIKALNSVMSLRSGKIKEIAKETEISSYGFSSINKSNENSRNIGSGQEVFFEAKEYYYYKSKEDFKKDDDINSELESKVLLENDELMTKFNGLLELMDDFNNNTNLGDESSISSLKSLRGKILNEYSSSSFNTSLYIEKGDTEANIKNGNIFSVTYNENGKKKSSVCFGKDGTIILNCKDFIINKEVQK